MEKTINKDFGFILDSNHHKNNKWVCSLTPFLVEGIIREFNPVIIDSQSKYDQHKNDIKTYFSMEPGWGAPKIKYDIKKESTKGMLLSDPHSKTSWLEDYVCENEIDYVFSYYKQPFFKYFPNFDKKKFIHFPWAIPDKWIFSGRVNNNGNLPSIFGGQKSDAYSFRNWCRKQKGVINYENSGVENKRMTDNNYFLWLRDKDAIIAAGSFGSKYNLVTPKYFEIPSSGSLLIGQFCEDLDGLGFNQNNSLIFKSKGEFRTKIKTYIEHPDEYLEMRERGRDLILSRHKISDRLKLINNTFKLI